MTARKSAIVSGGSRGLGQAIVRRLLADGYRVATFSRAITPFVTECLQAFQDAFHWEAIDAEEPEQLRGFVRAVVQKFERLDVLVNNAGVGTEGVLALMRDEDIHRCLSVNLESVIHLTRACVRVMLGQEGGSIVSISSIVGRRGHDGVSVYGATKAAIDGFTRGLARELGSRNIRVNAVAPGYFESDMVAQMPDAQKQRIARRTPLGRLGNVNDIAAVVGFLLGPDARFITGQTLVVDGGLTV